AFGREADEGCGDGLVSTARNRHVARCDRDTIRRCIGCGRERIQQCAGTVTHERGTHYEHGERDHAGGGEQAAEVTDLALIDAPALIDPAHALDGRLDRTAREYG